MTFSLDNNRLRFKITDELMKQIAAEAELLWPGDGTIAIKRLIRDCLKRLWRYCGGNDRDRHRDG